jgi:hypothetical protein
MRFEGFVGPSYEHRSRDFDAQRTVNLYPEKGESGSAKSVSALLGTPGLSTFATLPQAPVRGVWAGGERLFAAAGTKIYEVMSNGTSIEKGTIATDADHSPVQIFPNGNQLFVVSAGLVYLHNGVSLSQPQWANGEGTVNTAGTAVTWVSGTQFDASMVGNPFVINSVTYTVATVNSATSITLTASAGTQTGVAYNATTPVTARTGAFLGSYFIAAPYGKKFYISALNDGQAWDALDFASKEGYPDNIASVLADHEELWLFGDETTEVWRVTGNADFPFERDPSATVHQGIVAPWSAVNLVTGPAWLGGDTRGRVIAYAAQGFQPVRISTHAVESAWASFTKVSDAIGYVYTEEGHTFWVITFPTANATWAFDYTTKLWHERAWWNGSGFARHRGRCHAFVFGKHLVGDHTSGKIYQMSLATFDDDGTPIQRLRAAPHISDEQQNIFYSKFQLDLETGLATNPAYTLEWSNDGGHTWTTPRTRTAGAIGNHKARVIWRRLGSARTRVFRVQSNAAIRHAWIAAHIDLSKGSS